MLVIGLVLTLTSVTPNTAFIDRLAWAEAETSSVACDKLRVERDMVVKERDVWKAETIKQAQNALVFERRAETAERSLDREQRAHERTKLQRDALLAAPKPSPSGPQVELSLLPSWMLPVVVGVIALGVGLGVGASF